MYGVKKKKKREQHCEKYRTPTLDGGRGSGQPPPTYRTECESLKACVPHQLPGPFPNPLMRLDLNYEGREGSRGGRGGELQYSFTLR